MIEDLIKRSDAIKAVEDGMCTFYDCDVLDRINAIPSTDRPQGEWIETSEGTMCSNCHKFPYDDGEYHIANWHSDFCPRCGAKMGEPQAERSE